MANVLSETLGRTESARARREAVRRAPADSCTVEELLRDARELRRRDPAAALRLARAGLALARIRGAPPLVGEASHVLGQVELLLGRPRHALRRQRVARDHPDPGIRLAVAMDTAASLSLLGYESEARSALANARELARRGRRPEVGAAIDLTEANLLVRLDLDAEALDLYARARRVLARAGKPQLLTTVDLNRANVLTNLGRFAAAERLYRRVLAAHRRDGRTASALQVEYNHANLTAQRGRTAEASAELRAVRERFAAAGDERHVALCDLDLAEAHLRMSLAAEAAAFAQSAAQALTRLGLAHDAARARLFYATALRELGERAPAQAELERARAALRDVGARAWEAVALHHLAELDAEEGLLVRARDRALEASRQLNELGLLERGGRAEVLAARMDLALDAAPAAVRRLTALEARLGGVHAPWLRCELHRDLACALDAARKPSEALRHALEAVRLFETHRIAVPPDEHRTAHLRHRGTIHEEAIRLTLRAGRKGAKEAAFALAQRAKSGVGRVRLPEGTQGAARPRALDRRARAIAAELDVLVGRMPSDDPHRGPGDAGRTGPRAAERERQLAEAMRRRDGAGTDARRRRAPVVWTAAALRRRLPADVTLLDYFVGEQTMFAFVATRARLEVVTWPQSRARLRELVASWRATALGQSRPAGAASTPGRDEESRRLELATLHALVLRPIGGRLRTPRVVIVPHDCLTDLPFDDLFDARVDPSSPVRDVRVGATVAGGLEALRDRAGPLRAKPAGRDPGGLQDAARA